MKGYLYIFFATTIFIFSQCQKGYELQIVGTWRHGNISDQYDSVVWKFHDDGVVEVIRDPNCNSLDTCFGTYFVEGMLHIPYVTIEDIGDDINGKYQADELSNKFLKMTRKELEDGESEGAYLRREFVKQ